MEVRHRTIMNGLAKACALAALAAAAPEPVLAKSHSEYVNPHCRPDPSGPDGAHQLACSIEGPGKFTLYTEASFKRGQPGASAQVTVVIDGHPCGHGELVSFTGSQTVDNVCNLRETGGDAHAFVVAVNYKLAEYGSAHVTVVRQPPKPPRPGAR